MTTPAASSPPPITTSPEIGTMIPMNSATPPRTASSAPRPYQRRATLPGASANQPWSTANDSSRLLKSSTLAPNPSRSSSARTPSAGASSRSWLSAYVSASLSGRRALSRRWAASWSFAGGLPWVWIETFLWRNASSASNWSSPRLARSSSAVVRARRDELALVDERAGRRREVGRRGRHEHRRVVDVDRVAAVAQPVEDRPADEHEEQARTERPGRGPR